jgi:single-stranded DNA-binding protein
MERNEVTLVGRLSDVAQDKPLPSGGVLTTWRVIIKRERRDRGPYQDTINCVTFDPEVTTAVAECRPDDVIEVVGALRRRFYKSTSGTGNSHEVEAISVRLLQRKVVVTIGQAVTRPPGLLLQRAAPFPAREPPAGGEGERAASG